MRHLYNSVCTTNNERNIAIFAEMAAGGMGFDVINDTNEHIGNYYKILPVTPITFGNVDYYRSTEVGGYSGGALSGITVPAGVPVLGDFVSVTLSNGTALAYFMY
jgi:hypothetical protein